MVGFVYVGPVGDGGWTYSHDLGRQEMAKLPFVKKTQIIESVPEGADAVRVITSLAQKDTTLSLPQALDTWTQHWMWQRNLKMLYLCTVQVIKLPQM